MSNPLFSVVIPCFNVADTIAETIESVQSQTLQDFEIIAVNNNATDRTAEVLSSIARNEPRLRIVQQPVQGVSATRNLGIQLARGQIIALLDGDDMWDTDYFDAHVANLADESIGLSFPRVRFVNYDGSTAGQISRPKLGNITATDLLSTNPCTSSSFIVARRGVFEIAGLFNEDLHRAEDQEWLFRAAHAGVKFSGINCVLGSYRAAPGSLSSDLQSMLDGHNRFLDIAEQIAPDLVARRRRLAHASMLRYCARHSLNRNNGLDEAMGYLGRMFREAPDLVLREPAPTLKTAFLAAMACKRAWLHGKSNTLNLGHK